MATTEPTLEQIYFIVLPLIRRAGQMLVARQRELWGKSDKERHTRGQEIEQEIRDFLVSTLQLLFPNYGVHGKQGSVPQTWQWVVTPLDGSRYYFRGLPLYTTAIALRDKGEIVLGIIYQPVTGNVFHALKGGGAFMNTHAITVSNQKEWVGTSAYVPASKHLLIANKAGADCHNLGVTSLGLCYLAAGVYDVLLVPIDMAGLFSQAAGLIIAREAGAKLSDVSGGALGGGGKLDTLLAATPGLQKKAVQIFNK
ncbi:MAG: inositol monophosphatase [Patescibacteria group bacterium]|jgi:myo-inositol-1(or 4)-monophosphatase